MKDSYWPTILLGLVSLGLAVGIVKKRLDRRPAPEEPALEGSAEPLAKPEHALAAPAPAPLTYGKPVDSAKPAQDPQDRVAGLPFEDPKRVQPEIEGPHPAVALLPDSGDPFTNPEAAQEALGIPPALSFSGQTGPAKAGHRVVSTPAQWRALWKELAHGEAPPVDFKRQMLVCVFGGAMPAGRGVEIASVSEKGGKLHVRWRKTAGTGSPGGRPYQIQAIARSERPVLFAEERK